MGSRGKGRRRKGGERRGAGMKCQTKPVAGKDSVGLKYFMCEWGQVGHVEIRGPL